MLRFLHWLTEFLWLRCIEIDLKPYLDRYWIRGWLPAKVFTPLIMTPRGATWRDYAARPLAAEKTSWGIYLHHFRSKDPDRHPHSHPWWWAFSIILAGGYTEQRIMKDGSIRTKRFRPGMVSILRHDTFHHVSELHGRETWTLFVCGEKTSHWGFWVNGKFVYHRDYENDQGARILKGDDE